VRSKFPEMDKPGPFLKATDAIWEPPCGETPPSVPDLKFQVGQLLHGLGSGVVCAQPTLLTASKAPFVRALTAGVGEAAAVVYLILVLDQFS
jgi:hypothetical protein